MNTKTSKILRVIGIIVLVISLVPIVVGFRSFSSNDFGGFFLLPIGVFIFGIGMMLTLVSFSSANIKNSRMLRNQMMNDMNRAFSGEKIICSRCGAENDFNAMYCKMCGEKLKNTCPSCGCDNDSDASFCKSCGFRLK